MMLETTLSWVEIFQLVPHRLGDNSWDYSVTAYGLCIYTSGRVWSLGLHISHYQRTQPSETPPFP